MNLNNVQHNASTKLTLRGLMFLGVLTSLSACGDDHCPCDANGNPSSSVSASLSPALNEWIGNYAQTYGSQSCSATAAVLTSSIYPDSIEYKSTSLKSSSVVVYFSKYIEYSNCKATVTFPIRATSSRNITYNAPSISVAVSESYSSSNNQSKCDTWKSELVSKIKGAGSSNYTMGSSYLEFTDPVDGRCSILTKG